MSDLPPKAPPAVSNRKFVLILGVSIGIGIGAGRAVEDALVTSLGYWGALACSILASACLAAVVALIMAKIMR
jgi:hypothetical protein